MRTSLLLFSAWPWASWAAPPARPRVFLIGVDAANWRFIDPLVASKRLPNLTRLLDRGCSATLKSDVSYSPVTWTSIATGKDRSKHGIDSLDPHTGMPSRTQRRVKAVWNILSDHGVPVLLSSYLVTHPAETIDGVIVTKEWLDSREEAEGGLFPPDAFKGSSRELPKDATGAGAFHVASDAPTYSLQSEWARKVNGLSGAMDGESRAVWVARHFLSRRRFGFLAVHLWALDFASHSFLKTPSSGVLERHYERVDGLIGSLLEFADADTTVLVLSDHGAEENPDIRKRGAGAWVDEGRHHPDGILVAAGPGIRRCSGRGSASVFDVTPTVLALMGLPAAADMDGAPLTAFLDPRSPAGRPKAPVPTYEGPALPADPGTGPAPHGAETELLREMGYLR